MAAEIEAAGGTVEKFAGDAVMAAFGAPAAQEDHAERALHAALAMQRRLDELFGDTLALRIGVNTGEVVVGRAREGSSFVTGDAVNVAARLEQAAAPGEILVGERTAAAARGAFEFGEPMTVEAKGKEGGVACRPRSCARCRSCARAAWAACAQAFVGRERRARAAAGRPIGASSSAGEPHLVTIMGDAGVGKTRLVRELWERLATSRRSRCAERAAASSYGQGITYWPLGEVLKEHFGILESDPPESLARRLAATERSSASRSAWTSPRTCIRSPRASGSRGLGRASSRSSPRNGRWWCWSRTSTGRRSRCSISLDRLARDVDGPLLLLATARPELLERRPRWGGAQAERPHTLARGAHRDRDRANVSRRCSRPSCPSRCATLIVERAEGNPFFVEELVATLIDQGVLERVERRLAARELPAGFEIPDSVQAVLAARIDLLRRPRRRRCRPPR